MVVLELEKLFLFFSVGASLSLRSWLEVFYFKDFVGHEEKLGGRCWHSSAIGYAVKYCPHLDHAIV